MRVFSFSFILYVVKRKEILFFFLVILGACHPKHYQSLRSSAESYPSSKIVKPSHSLVNVESPRMSVLFGTTLLGSKALYQFRLIDHGFLILPESVAQELKKGDVPLARLMDQLLPQVRVYKHSEDRGWLTRDLSMVGPNADLLFSLFYSNQLDGSLLPILPQVGEKNREKTKSMKGKKLSLTLPSLETGTQVLLFFSKISEKFFAQIEIDFPSVEDKGIMMFSYQPSIGKTCAVLQGIGESNQQQLCIRIRLAEQ